MGSRAERWRGWRHGAPLALLGVAVATLLVGSCAAEKTPAAKAEVVPASAPKSAPPSGSTPPASAPAAAPTAPTAPAAPPAPAAATAASQPAPARPITDFQWPKSLPSCSTDVPPLFKGLVIGTWVPEGESGFDQAWLDEQGVREAWTKASASRRTWKGFAVTDPTVLVDSLLNDRPGPAVGYLFSLIARTGAGPDLADEPAVVHVRHRGRLRAFFDGLPLLDLPAPPPGRWGEAKAKVVLSGPYSVLLLKLGRGTDALGPSMDVEVRVSAPDGSPLPGQTWNTMRPGVVPVGG